MRRAPNFCRPAKPKRKRRYSLNRAMAPVMRGQRTMRLGTHHAPAPAPVVGRGDDRMISRILLIALFCLLAGCARPNHSAPASSAQAAAYREGRLLQMETNRCVKHPSTTDSGAFHCLWLSIKDFSWTVVHCFNGCPALVRAESAPKTNAIAAPPPPTHYYVYEKDGEYGYEASLSQYQINSGAVSSSLFMIRYLGEHEGVFRAENVDGAYTTVLSCSSPCSYITARYYYYNPYLGSQLLKKEVFPAGSTVAAAIMQDAMNGQLRVYGSRRRAAHARWLAAQARLPPYVTTATALIAANNRNQQTLRQLLEGRRVQISGHVARKSSTTSNGLIPEIALGQLVLNFPNSEHVMIAHLHRGQSVTVLCQSMNEWFTGAPVGEKCQLLKQGTQVVSSKPRP